MAADPHLEKIINRVQHDEAGRVVLMENDYLWLICSLSRAMGELAGVEMVMQWERAAAARAEEGTDEH